MKTVRRILVAFAGPILLVGCGTSDEVAPIEKPAVQNYSFADGTDTLALVLIDVDDDGDLDLLEGNAVQTNHVYLNDGSERPFESAVQTPIAQGAHFTVDLIAVDVNGDDKIDIVEANQGPNQIYLNEGDGTWAAGFPLTSDALPTYTLAAADLNGDGNAEVALGNSQGNVNQLIINSGLVKSSDTGKLIRLGKDKLVTERIVFVDMNGDSKIDLLTANAGEVNRLYLNSGSRPWFAKGTDLSSDTTQSFTIAAGDVNGDGAMDVVTGEFGANVVYLQDGTTGEFSATSVGHTDGITRAVQLHDFDGDGKLDLVAGNLGGVNRVYWNTGEAPYFSVDSVTDFDTRSDSTRTIVLGDIDGNGMMDILVGNADKQANRIILNPGR